MLARGVERNEVIKSSDVVIERRPKAEVGNDLASRDRAVGMQARKQLRAGQALKTADLAKPDLVQKDQAVILIYQAVGLHLTIRGKALEGGTEGDVVNVMNLQSKRTVSGVVTGRGQVSITGAGAPPARSLRRDLLDSVEPGGSAGRDRRQRRLNRVSKSRVMVMYASRIHRLILTGALLMTAALASGCSSLDRLSQIGEKPKLSAIENPTAQPGYKPVQMPMPKPETASYNANSLWRNGSRAFFKDQRAARIGDILTITVNFTDKANMANESQRSRTSKEDSGITDFAGSKLLTGNAAKVLPGKLLVTESAGSYDGKGSVVRQENLQTNVAAVVTQLLPNGNLVVEGKQEIRVNFEIRELIVAGIVRPEDIQSDNTIDSSKIAQARIAYGGRGQITDVQQPRYGQQVTDILLPF